ncbi:Mitogen-activated protein kinase kinase kinase [Trema orientale]|uniref:Mitogen-activated protein kinase kinase kinase n=1 Tax=Trema orientale TaxID=63057 RepID=A0A2P5FUS0_TREOI|nr:Mitogen-activated protein kinase kinase kinase [Trema orientale]
MSYKDQTELFIWVLLIFNWATFSCGLFDPKDNYLIDCGSPTNTSIGKRTFISDIIDLKILSTSQEVVASTNISKSVISSVVDGINSPLYQTARIFTKISKYTFSTRQHGGRHWIRLYFFPFVHKNYDMSTANFAVSTENHVLLSHFTASNTASVKEFSVNVTSDSLVITFTPSANSFAFLNAIEVVSVPDELITDDARTVDTLENFQGLSTQALETVARVNMGGPMLSSGNDTLWRTWFPDQNFLVNKNAGENVTINIEDVKYSSINRVTPYIAPHEVYSTATKMNFEAENAFGKKFNITWEFKVDEGFRYLVRFHFCDIVSKQLNTLYFSVYIDSWNVARDLDLSALSFNSLRSALYMDYVTMSTTSDKLHVSVGPSTLPSVDPDAILNGLEIMKLNNSIGSLSATSSALGISPNISNPKKKYRVLIISASIGAFILIGLALVLSLTTCKNKRSLPLSVKRGISHFRGSKNFNGKRASSSSIVDLDFGGNRIPFVAIQEATNNFEESWVIGTGGFGKVYKGFLKDGTKVAIKRKTSLSQQGLAEFETEIKMLSQFRHRHLVSMIGYCDEQSEMILVYEYVENGTLRSHLYGSGLPVLSWKQRLEICIGAARGLHYLHTGFSKAIIHRDVKTANILLDENLMAKVADFGLSKTGPDTSQADYVSTAVKGSFGYFDPEYFRKRRLTLKSDVYSFGVVLFEVLCGRAAVDSSLPTEKIGLAGWAMKWQKVDKLEQIIDPSLEGSISPDSLWKFGEIAERCLAEFGANRPSMGEVLQNLECALRLQEAAREGDLETSIGCSEVAW